MGWTVRMEYFDKNGTIDQMEKTIQWLQDAGAAIDYLMGEIPSDAKLSQFYVMPNFG